MTNAFTKKPDTSWVKSLERSRRNSASGRKAIAKPTELQRVALGPIGPGTKFGLPTERKS